MDIKKNIKKLLRFRSKNRNCYRFTWGEFSTGFNGFGVGIGCSATEDSDGKANISFSPFWGSLYIKLWKGSAWNHDDMYEGISFKVWFDERAILLYWKSWHKIIYLPWAWEFERHTILSEKETHDYAYTLESGEVQKVTATIQEEEREWRWRCFKKLPYPRMIKKTIDIEFSGEVGEKTGTWKGGCIGCGYNMKKGETPLQTLRRMEKERKF